MMFAKTFINLRKWLDNKEEEGTKVYLIYNKIYIHRKVKR